MQNPTSFTIACLTLLLFAGCTPTGGAVEEKPASKVPVVEQETGEAPEVPPATPATTTITVASVQLLQDCPDAEEPALAPAAKPEPDGELAGDGVAPAAQPGERMRGRQPPSMGDMDDSYRQPCAQSSFQLALETDSGVPVQIEVKAVRMLEAGRAVATLTSRKPTVWRDNGYVAWDEQLAPSTATKVSYKFAPPPNIGYGSLYILEIDVAVDGEIQTITSPDVPRELPEVMVT